MRPSTALLPLLAATASAQSQAPLLDQVKGWFAKATAAATSLASAATSAAPNPANAGAAALSSTQVTKLTLDNHKSLLAPGAATSSPGIDSWLIFITGGNKTCYGKCLHAETQFNRSVPALTVTKPSPNLAWLDCETQGVLCAAWTVSPPSLYYFRIPHAGADQSQPQASAWYVPLNRTSVTSEEITKVHTEQIWTQREGYDGFWHPIDGPLAQAGLDIYFGYLAWGFAKIPSWAFMIGISMLSRTVMSKRMSPQAGRGPGAAPATAQRPAAST